MLTLFLINGRWKVPDTLVVVLVHWNIHNFYKFTNLKGSERN
jgi:hypothetical protein